jgi:hypothetical protein
MFELIPYWTEIQKAYDLFLASREVIYPTVAAIGFIWWWARGRKIKSMKRELKIYRELMKSREETIDALQHYKAVSETHKKFPEPPEKTDLKLAM